MVNMIPVPEKKVANMCVFALFKYDTEFTSQYLVLFSIDRDAVL